MLDDEFLASKTYHMICTPARCIDLCTNILARRERMQSRNGRLPPDLPRPAFIWEPMEDSCRPTEKASFVEALKYVDVFSPNEREILALCNLRRPKAAEFELEVVHRAGKELVKAAEGSKLKAVVARCGPHGCLVAEKDSTVVLPAYHDSARGGSQQHVVDATGGGNTFLGGFCAAVADDLRLSGFSMLATAALHGNVAASFAIEQVGPPSFTIGANGEELWNQVKPSKRLQELMLRTSKGHESS